MRVLCSNQTGELHGYLCGRFPGLVGHLFSTDGKFSPWAFAPYALDNGAFPAWSNQRAWDEAAWLKLLDKATACPMQPLWALVPDVVTDKERTIENWHRYAPLVRERGFHSLAFAVQDGMQAEDVPADADVIFVGGSYEWKWETVQMWCAYFARVHVGRVNRLNRLMECYNYGAESTDGTGWFRGDDSQLNGLVEYLTHAQANGKAVQEDAANRLGRLSPKLSLFKYRDAQSDCGQNKLF